MKKFLASILIIFTTFQTVNAKPSLMLDSYRVIIEPNTRSSFLTVMNNGSQTGRYEFKVITKRMDENGKFVIIDEAKETAREKQIRKMLRISPRRISIEPNSHQTVRLFARKTANLDPGEYVSRLVVTLLPESNEIISDQDNKDKPLTVSPQISQSISIPVIIQQGELNVSSQISNMKLSNKNKSELSFRINREGNKSLFGDIIVKYIGEDGKEEIINTIRGLAVYNPNPFRNITIKLGDAIESISGGEIVAIYQNQESEEIYASNKLGL